MSKAIRAAIAAIDRTQPARLRAVDYLRVSTEEQAKGYGIAYTGKKTGRYIAGQDWEHVATFKDEGESGTLPWEKRTDAKRLMALAKQTPRPFDVVTVYETRAIGRKDRVFYRWYWELQDLGIFVAVVDLDIDTTTEEGEAAMRKAANDAFDEIVRIRKRTQNGLQEKAEDGGHVGGVAPFGWRIEDQGKRGMSQLAIDPEASATLRLAWDILVNGHKSCATAAVDLNSRQKLGPGGRPWDSASLRHALTKRAVQEGRRAFRSESRSPNPGQHEVVMIDLDRIFSEDEVARLNVALARTARPTHGAPVAHPLSKRITGACGAHYTGCVRPGRQRHEYRCSGKGCGCSQIDGSALEGRVWDEVVRLLADPDRLAAMSSDWAANAADGHVDHESRVQELSDQIDQIADSIDVTMTVAARQAARKGLRGKAAEEAVERAIKPLNVEAAQLEVLRSEAQAWRRDAAEAAQRGRDLQALAELARKRLPALDASQKAEVLALLDIRVTILGDIPRKTRGDDQISAWFRARSRVVPSLTDDAWALTEPIFSAPRAGRKPVDPRRLLNALLYKARTGCAWQAIPDGSGRTALAAWQRWSKSGLWEQLMDALKDTAGTTVPADGVKLPPLDVRGQLEPRLWNTRRRPARRR